MEVDRPGPGEELNTRATSPCPRQAASVIVLRGGDAALEVLLVRRTPQARFMGGVWVFPGGAVDAHEGEGDASHRLAAVRELEEEAGIAGVDAGALVQVLAAGSRRAEVKIRFDTHFFLAALPEDAQAGVDGDEIVDGAGSRRQERSRRTARGELAARLPDDQAPRAARAVRERDECSSTRPGATWCRWSRASSREGEVARVVLPGEPGYDDGPELFA